MATRPTLVLRTIPDVFNFRISEIINDSEVGYIVDDPLLYARKSKKDHPNEGNVVGLSHPSLIHGIRQDSMYVYIPYYVDSRDVFTRIDTETLKWEHLTQMVTGVKHLSDNSIAHLDIKPENFLVLNNESVKIIDFGRCTKNVSCIPKGVFVEATPGYNAPEIYDDSESVDPYKADVFSMGLVIFVCVFRCHPIETQCIDPKHWMRGHNLDEIIDDFVGKNPTNQPVELLKDIMSVVKIMTRLVAKDRLSITEASRRLNDIIHKYGVIESVI
jgi:serine/threonine protein kinase